MGEVHIPRTFSIPAAIQFKNPGAMWPGAVATKWGSTKWQYLSDGTGQGGGGHGNKIAIFDNWVDGICAQMDLWRSSANYKNKTFLAAISTWSGHNHVQSYVDYLKSRVPGLTEGTVMNDAFWASSMAIPFLRAQATHEAGKPIPATPSDYSAAQKRVMSGVPTPRTAKKAAGAVVVVAAPVVAHVHSNPSHLVPALLVGVAVLVVGLVAWKVHEWLALSGTSLPSPSVSPPVLPSSPSPVSTSGASIEQIQERVGGTPDTQPVLRDQSGQDAGPVHVEGT